MKIYGISQSTGVERQLKIEHGTQGLVLTLTDTVGLYERGQINVPGDNLAGVIENPSAGGATIEGIRSRGERTSLDVEVRRNEVLLRVHPGDDADIAVGLGDLQDALKELIPKE